MALADSKRAIGATTNLLVDHLIRHTTLTVTANHPRQASATGSNPKLNLFLYELGYDPHLKNVSLQEGMPAPLWLVLKYLLTAYDPSGLSDTALAHELVGRGLAALQEVNWLLLDSAVEIEVRKALENNPEVLKITFGDAPAELLSKLMQGPDETYRFSAAFQVQPVMIAPSLPPNYNLLVGINYQTAPPSESPEARGIFVLPSMGPRIAEVTPESFDSSAGDATAPEVEITGEDLHLSNLRCLLGRVEVPIVAQRADRLTIRVGSAVAAGRGISAGEHPVVIQQTLPNGRFRSSNLLSARLRPTLISAEPPASGAIVLHGLLLGREEDDVQAVFYREGVVARMVDDVTAVPGQAELTVNLPNPPAQQPIPAGTYQLILRVNGQQALNSPVVRLP